MSVSRPEIQLGVGIINCNGVRSKLLNVSLRKLSTSSFTVNFLECKLWHPGGGLKMWKPHLPGMPQYDMNAVTYSMPFDIWF